MFDIQRTAYSTLCSTLASLKTTLLQKKVAFFASCRYAIKSRIAKTLQTETGTIGRCVLLGAEKHE
jgi:hypothetical protein